MQNQSPNNMITSIDKIPLKTSGSNITEDMTDDPIVKDVLNEFEKELSLNETNIHFLGRLANYKYFNMDEAILNALEYFDTHFKETV